MRPSEFLWVEQGDEATAPVAEVAPLLRIDRTYTYRIPPAFTATLKIGQRVRVPLRKSGRLVEGFVVNIDRGSWDTTLRPIDSVVEKETYLSPHLVELGRRISRHYVCPLGSTLKAMTPQAVRARRGLTQIRELTLNHAAPVAANRITVRQKAVIDFLRNLDAPVEFGALARQTGMGPQVLRTLLKRGILLQTQREIAVPVRSDDSPTTPEIAQPGFALNSDQETTLRQILEVIRGETFHVMLLFGVSGSGKTEVYIRAIQEVLRAGRQAIFLVPEIVLTTQLARRLAARLPRVALQHSGLSESQRAALWRQIASGERPVVIGTRSAVFAPCPNLGLIVVDEEQESSYKNLQAPRYHVRDVAIMRARQHNIPILLGSATPSLETWHRSHSHPDYSVYSLPRRVLNLPLPRVHVVDMRDEILEQKKPVLLSRAMESLLSEALERGEQAIILVNRRGFALRAICPRCRSRLACPNCSSSLVIHAATNQAICHYCRTRIQAPTLCPQLSCGATLLHVGTGTQRVEELLSAKFPHCRIRRVDSDAISRRKEYEELISDLEARRVDVIVGTQMIAKGLDFPHVSFVGMIHSDSEGFSADFRAHERLFQLVTQVAGRAGRASAAGDVVIQTLMPELPALRFALTHDYVGFAGHELALRQELRFPPFTRLARFLVSHARDEQARMEAAALAERIRHTAGGVPGVDLLGPTPAPIPRLRGQYRYDLLVRASSGRQLQDFLQGLRDANEFRIKSAGLTIDVDPVSLA